MKTHTTIGGLIIGDHSSELLRMAKTIALSTTNVGTARDILPG
jgi:co-chaperonin GroES (HSP10)